MNINVMKKYHSGNSIIFYVFSHVFSVHLHKSKFTRLAEMSKQENGRDWRRENLGYRAQRMGLAWELERRRLG